MTPALSRLLVRTEAYGAWWRLVRWYRIRWGRKFVRAVVRERARSGDRDAATASDVYWVRWAGEPGAALHERPIRTRLVVAMGPAGGRPTIVVKLPNTRAANRTLARQFRELAAIHADARLHEWCAVVPVPLAEGVRGRQQYALEQALPGGSGHDLLFAFPCARLLSRAANAIRDLHTRTASTVMVDAAVLERWVHDPIRRMRCMAEAECGAGYHQDDFQLLAAEMTRALSGRLLQASRVHGDFWLGNVLMDPDTAEVTGVIDWDRSGTQELPVLDLVHMLLITRMFAASGRTFGEIVESFLRGADWREEEKQILEGSDLPFSLDDEPGQRLLVALCWIRRTSQLQESFESRPDRIWFDRNLGVVLAAFAAAGCMRIAEGAKA